jgi:hypothetical protein
VYYYTIIHIRKRVVSIGEKLTNADHSPSDRTVVSEWARKKKTARSE